ncbi:MAG: hypothetical protein R3C05_12065 [Pirellulaceae bacterium]
MTDHTGFATDRKLDNKVNKCVGIWRLLEHFHHGPWTDLYYAQPAEAAGSPRADYVVKMVTDTIDAAGRRSVAIAARGCVYESGSPSEFDSVAGC